MSHSTPTGSAWLLLELCSTSLHQVLRHRGTLEEAQIAAVCAGTLRGLDWLHASCRIVRQAVDTAVLAAPQLTSLACWGWGSRLLAALRTRHSPEPNGREAAVRP